MIYSYDDLMKRIKEYIGDKQDDETLSFIEDISDSVKQNTEWERKYKENDDNWRKKYRERFFTDDESENITNGKSEKNDENNVDITIDDLFKEV